MTWRPKIGTCRINVNFIPLRFISAVPLWQKKAIKAVLSETWTLVLTPARFSNWIKESQIEWTSRLLVMYNVCGNHFSQSCLLIVCTLTEILSFYCQARNWLKTVKSRRKWDVAENYMCYNKADTWMAMMIWVRHLCHQTYQLKTVIVSGCHCVDHHRVRFVIWAAWDEIVIIKPVLRQQWREKTDKTK